MRTTFIFVRFRCARGHEHGQIVEISKRYEPVKCVKCNQKSISSAMDIDTGKIPFSQRSYPYHDRIQGRTFNSQKDYDRYCRNKNLYKPTQAEIKRHREEFQYDIPKKTA